MRQMTVPLLVFAVLLCTFQGRACFADESFPMERLGELRRAMDAAAGDEAAVRTWLAKGFDPDVTGSVVKDFALTMTEFMEMHYTLTGEAHIDWRPGDIVLSAGGCLIYEGMPLLAFLREFSGRIHGPLGLLSQREIQKLSLWGPVNVRGPDELWTWDANEVAGTTRYGKFVFCAKSSDPVLLSWEVDQRIGVHSYLNVAPFVHGGELLMVARAWDPAPETVNVEINHVYSLNPLLSAVANGRTGVANILLEAGASVIPNGPGKPSAFHVAATYDMPNMIDLLVDAGFDPDLQDGNGETALFYAVRQNNPRVLRTLIGRNAAYSTKNLKGDTPRKIASSLKHSNCLALLKWREPLLWSAAVNLFIATADEGRTYETFAPGAGLGFELHRRLSHTLWLTTEVSYSIRTAAARSDEQWLPEDQYVNMPSFEYHQLDISPRLSYAFASGWRQRVFGVAGLEYRTQMSASLVEEGGGIESIDVSDSLNSSGLAFTIGIGFNRFTDKGMLVGMELRRSMSLTGDYTSRGGGLSSWVLMFRIGS
jgi:uncharacterized protein